MFQSFEVWLLQNVSMTITFNLLYSSSITFIYRGGGFLKSLDFDSQTSCIYITALVACSFNIQVTADVANQIGTFDRLAHLYWTTPH